MEQTKPKNIYQKLIEVRKAVPYLQKTESGNQYKYVGSSGVLTAVRGELDKQGLLLIPRVKSVKVTGDTVEKTDNYGTKHTTTWFTELTMEYTWINADNPEEKIVCEWYGQGVDIAGEKGVGKALTYAEKYFLLKFFNIATDTDDPDKYQELGNNELHINHEPKLISKPAGDTITEKQAKRLFAIAKGNQDLVRNTIGKYGYERTSEIKKAEYENICNEISDNVKMQIYDDIPFMGDAGGGEN
ncbi:MAG: ERF family protein [Clostridiales bacterium]|nr:ERF family protein [Clostridiales bacterium]